MENSTLAFPNLLFIMEFLDCTMISSLSLISDLACDRLFNTSNAPVSVSGEGFLAVSLCRVQKKEKKIRATYILIHISTRPACRYTLNGISGGRSGVMCRPIFSPTVTITTVIPTHVSGSIPNQQIALFPFVSDIILQIWKPIHPLRINTRDFHSPIFQLRR